MLYATASNPQHPNFLDATSILWITHNVENQAVARPVLLSIVSTPSLLRYKAFTYLFDSDNVDDRRIAEVVAKQIMIDLEHVDNVKYVMKLLGAGGEISKNAITHIRTVLSEGRGSEQLRNDYSELLELCETL